jgi:hypothetical protein
MLQKLTKQFMGIPKEFPMGVLLIYVCVLYVYINEFTMDVLQIYVGVLHVYIADLGGHAV